MTLRIRKSQSTAQLVQMLIVHLQSLVIANMELNLPSTFVHLSTAEGSPKDTHVNVIGVVVDYQPPVQTRGAGEKMNPKLIRHY
jgi:hypothetical protein